MTTSEFNQKAQYNAEMAENGKRLDSFYITVASALDGNKAALERLEEASKTKNVGTVRLVHYQNFSALETLTSFKKLVAECIQYNVALKVRCSAGGRGAGSVDITVDGRSEFGKGVEVTDFVEEREHKKPRVTYRHITPTPGGPRI